MLETNVKTGLVRFSYPHLFEKWAADDNQEPKYGITLIISKSDKKTLEALEQAYKNATINGTDKYGKKFSAKGSPFVRPVGGQYGLLIDCDKDPEKYSGDDYKGKYLLPLKSTTKPTVLAVETGKKHLEKEEGEEIVYPGCYGKVTLSVYPYLNARSGISASVNNVIKTQDGEPFSGRTKAEDDFAEELEAMTDEELADLI